MMAYSVLLREIVVRSKNKIESIDERELSSKTHPEKWSKKEILGHLIDSAYNNHQRFTRASLQDNLVFQGYDQESWVVLNDYQNRTKEDVLDTWVSANQHLSVVINNLPEKLLNRKTTDHNFHQICMNLLEEGQATSLSYLIWDYIFHLEHHLQQIIPDYQWLSKPYED